MKILDIKVMRGPNYWSITRPKVIVMKLDLEEMENFSTDKIVGFPARIEGLLPGMYQHQCSEGHPGGFFERVRTGTWLGHVTEHIAIELQQMAGMNINFGQTRQADQPGVYHVVFGYEAEEAGRYAARAAVEIVQDLIEEPQDHIVTEHIQKHVEELKYLCEMDSPGPSSGAIINEAKKRNIPVLNFRHVPLTMLGYGNRQRRIQAALASTTSFLGVDLAGNKDLTKELLLEASIPVPEGTIVYDEQELELAIKRYGYPLVIKPLDGNQGKGAAINVQTRERALESLHAAQIYSKAVIVEKMMMGTDFRLLVVNYKFVAAALRTPAAVTGDGNSTIEQLIDMVNADPRRGIGHDKSLTYITVDDITETILKDRNLTLQSVLPAGETLFLKMTANLSTGGTSRDVTELMHPDNIMIAERIASTLGLDICGIDVIAPDISSSLYENGGAVLEVNAAPGLRMHLAPTEGTPRNVAAPILDMLFPDGDQGRIPIIAITGTNGKTTTTRLMAHIADTAGKKVGFTTTDGIYVRNKIVRRGDCTGPGSTELILKDPTVDFAVLECARGGMLREGLAFDQCDIGIVTNVSADHIGLGDIQNLEQMARLKSVVPNTVKRDGYAILNADDDRVYNMAKELDCNIAYFSMYEDSPRIKRHIEAGGLAAIVAGEYVVICDGSDRIVVEKIVDIPITFSGNATFMTQNVLPAVIASYLSGFTLETVREALHSFVPSPTQTPGRMNLFQFKHFQVLVDYAHNPAGLKAIGNYLERVQDKPKVGIIAGVGDRRDEDLVDLGRLAAGIFDEIIIRQDHDLRGRANLESINLLKEVILEVMPNKPITAIPEEFEAVQYALEHAVPGSLITICAEDIPGIIKILEQYREEEEMDRMVST